MLSKSAARRIAKQVVSALCATDRIGHAEVIADKVAGLNGEYHLDMQGGYVYVPDQGIHNGYPYPLHLDMDYAHKIFPYGYLTGSLMVEARHDLHIKPWQVEIGPALMSDKGNGIMLTYFKKDGINNPRTLWDGLFIPGEGIHITFNVGF